MNTVGVLGPVQVTGPDEEAIDTGGRRQRRLLAALAMHAGNVVSIDALVDIVFEGVSTEAAERTLQSYVSRLRRVVDTDGSDNGTAIARVAPGYVLSLETPQLDSASFEQQSRLGQELAAKGDHSAAVVSFDAALGLWRGTPYAEFADEPWAIAEAQRLRELRATTIEERAESRLALGDHGEVVVEMEQFVLEEPTRERPWAQLMVALHRSGRQVDALRVFQDCYAQLTEMGAEPSQKLRDLEQQIAAADPALDLTAGGYEVLERLGEGAFSIVYRGNQPSVGREVALKQIRAELADRPEFIRRFETEAHLVARLEHPHIVPLYDYWREPGSAYLVMRLLRGGNLETSLRSGPWELERTLEMVGQIGGALATAHRAGVVHRDVKPANILLDEEGNAYLTDFGIALEAHEADDPTASLSAGSPAYASPEQLRREPVGPAADVHGLGIVLYETLMGQLPFPEASNQSELLRHQLHDPIPPIAGARSDVPSALDAVIRRATAKHPDDRYQSVEEFVDAIHSAIEGSVAEAVRQGVLTSVVEDRNPFKGLRAFDEADSEDFTGRARLVDQLVSVIGRSRLLALVGPSGSGKSSVVRAGLLPVLRKGVVPGSEKWFVTTMMPGPAPFEELETALLRVAPERPLDLLSVLNDGDRGIARGVRHAVPEEDAQVLLVIDQFEELFTLAEPAVAARFLDALAVAVTEEHPRIRVILTLRADFYDRPLSHEAVGRLVREATVPVLPLAADELERAIVDPAARVGVAFEPGLVSQIVADVADQPGALPLLQYALTELYERRSAGLMTQEAYRSLGGVAGALGRRAEELFVDSPVNQQEAIRRAFGRLVSLGEGVQDTRRRARRNELGEDPAMDSVIDRYGAARLLSFDRDPVTREPTLEVAHEALIREWPRFRRWLDDDRDGFRLQRHLAESAAAWDTRDRDPGELYRGARLSAAVDWASTHDRDLTAVEEDFVDASRAQDESDRRREQQANRRLRALLVGVAAVAVVALLAGVLAFQQSQRANEEADEAVIAREDAEIRRLAADAAALSSSNRRVALLMAAEAYRREPGPNTLGALQRVLTGTDQLLGYLGVEDRKYERTMWRPGRPNQIVGLHAAGVDVFDIDNRSLLQSIPLRPGAAFRFDISSDGTQVAVAIVGTEVVVHDLDSGDRLVNLVHHELVVEALAFSGDGGYLATGDRGGLLRVFDTADWQPVLDDAILAHPETFAELDIPEEELPGAHEAERPPEGVRDIVWSADDSEIVTVGGVFVRRWSRDTGDKIAGVRVTRPGLPGDPPRAGYPSQVGFDPDNPDEVIVRTDPVIQWWNLNDGVVEETQEEIVKEVPLRLSDISGASVASGVVNVAFAAGIADRGVSVVVSELDAIRVFDVEDEEWSRTVNVQVGARRGNVAVSGDGRTAAIGGGEGIVLWALDGRGLIAAAVPSREEVVGAHASADGAFVSLHEGNLGSLCELFDVSSGAAHPVELKAGDDCSRADLGLPGALLTQQFDPAVLELSSLGAADRDPVSFGEINDYSLAVSADGSKVAFGAGVPDAPDVHVFKIPSGDPLFGGPLEFENLTSAARLRTAPYVLGLAFSPDGTRLVATNDLGAAVLIDATTGEWVADITSNGWLDLAFSPDGRLLATSDDEGQIILREPVFPFQSLGLPLVGGGTGSQTGGASSPLAFSSDSRYLVSTIDNQARLWDTETHLLIGSPFASVEGVDTVPSTNARFVPVAVSEDLVLVYELDVDNWFEIACEAAGRDMTPPEWSEFGPRDIEQVQTCADWLE